MQPSEAVRVLGVQLRDFRTYTRAEASLGERVTVVHGPNGAGKSNLLEALYLGCTGRSPRTRNDRELVRFGADAARVVVAFDAGERQHELSVGFGAIAPSTQQVKRMSADGATVERLLDVEPRPLVSVFMPERLELVKGAPALRRAHLDQVVAALWPARAQAKRHYAKVLAQRNALLARIRYASLERSTLSAWDRELADAGLALRDTRAHAVALLREPFAQRAAQLGLAGDAELEYRPRAQAPDASEYLEQLAARIGADLERGFTSYGPHRDELALLRDRRELRVFGSQGEQRMALLALLLAERSAMSEQRGRTPLMLLDDVMSELDGSRREQLAAELSRDGQCVIATTDLAHVPGAAGGAVRRLRISPGAIMQEAIAA